MHRFFIASAAISNGRAPLDAAEAQHALKVLRLSHGDAVEAMDGEGRSWTGTLLIENGAASIALGEERPSVESPLRLTLYMGLPKGEKLELIAQKLTEIGVHRIVPVRMERSVMRIAPNEAEKKLSRPRRIASEAMKQSGRQHELEVADPVDFKALESLLSEHERAFFMWELAAHGRLADAYRSEPALSDIAYIIGPEGGISDAEAVQLERWGARPLTMGPRILRAETAAIAGAAQIMALWGDM